MWGVGGCAHPEELLRRLTARQWAGWQAYQKHFSTPLIRADLNGALVRHAMLLPYSKRPPSVSELMPRYGTRPRRKSPAELFALAQAAFAMPLDGGLPPSSPSLSPP